MTRPEPALTRAALVALRDSAERLALRHAAAGDLTLAAAAWMLWRTYAAALTK